ncbi:tRNA (adenine(22)-N(1))-methyltransferase [Halopseudomonas pelagia]|uniref:SAM-dependent methyltransferase n=1 Tax=Halopseudomonas pelagia TaxID=553151 RepID=A0AA91Z4M7_9GAMM|nr:tRNA (adenine(22)-N(1))-methyltransferase TrmK [Halopseudomonas pelagia]PCC97998.1 SAM-dependent methyltransferase [Halopseudomonas pelagia]QFY55720.1 SAM-dependent methyltransferase [Halopseudomonas pelagia]
MKLSKRLKQIQSMVAPGYAHIWDCCCDHGLLGASLLTREAAPHIHFVDILPELISQLQTRLEHFYPHASCPSQASQWHTHCLDTAALPLARFPGRHLIIIAGVGGDLMTRFIKAICEQHPHASIDFLLCPVHQEYHLRQQLIRLGLRLSEEVLVKDNQRFYEVLRVSAESPATARTCDISPVGVDIWRANTPEQASVARAYLAKTLKHYQNVQSGGREDVREEIADYRAVRVSIGA